MKKQQGIGFIAFIICCAVVASMALVTIKTVPVYFEHFAVKRAIEGVAEDPELWTSPYTATVDAAKSLQKRFEIENVRNVNLKDVKIEDKGGYYLITANYGVKVPLFANVSLYFSFNDVAKASPRER